MRPDARYVILALLGLCVVVALAFSFSGPLLYSLQNDVFPSQFHENTDALKAMEVNSTTDVLPLMQDLLDYTGPIILNVRLQDIEQARHDLELFAKGRRSFNNLVLKLDMNESEMEDFSRSKANQEKILQELMNSSVSLDQLSSLEIQYRDRNDPTMLTSIRLQGETLRKKIRALSVQYRQESAKVTAISKTVGLDTTSEQESVQEFQRYVDEISGPQNQTQQQYDIPLRRSAQMSLIIFPESGVYGDTIRCFGYYFSLYGYRVSSTPGKMVTLYLDNRSIGKAVTDDTGGYSIPVPVEKITAGTHVVHAESGVTQSDERSLTIDPVDSFTTLTLTPSRKAGEVICAGTVIANLPVRNASVDLVWDGTHVSRTTTDADGAFSAPLLLRGGKHTVQARFTGAGYPINPSESSIQTIVVSAFSLPVDLSQLLYAAVFCLFALFVGGAIYYLRRAPGRSLFHSAGAVQGIPALPVPEVPEETVPEPDAFPPGIGNAPGDTLFQQYTALLRTAGLGEASHAAYSTLAGRIARDLRISRYRVLTPREISRSCRERPYCGPFSHLVNAYERIRYGGYQSAPVQEEFEATMQSTDAHLGGEDH
jgi:hypothetical protein